MTKRKAKTVLKNLDFSQKDCAIALVGPSVGGPANNQPILMIKSANFSAEHVEKASKVRVTMEFEEFLTRFFHLYYEDAKVLAAVLGMETEESDEEEDYSEGWYDRYIDSKVQAIEIIKSFKEKNIAEVVSGLSEEQHLQLLKSQASLEPLIKQAESDKAVEAGSDTSTNASVEKSVEPSGSNTKTEKELTVEMVEKSVLTTLQKSFDDQAVLLKKATDELDALKAASEAAIVKAKTEKVKAVVKDEAEQAVVLKAALAMESDADFDALIAFLTKSQSKVEKSALFEEKGASVDADADVVQEDHLTKLLKAQYGVK